MESKKIQGKLGLHSKIVTVVAGLCALYEVLIASRLLTWFGIFLPAPRHRAISLLFALVLIYCLRSPSGATREAHLTWYDFIFLGFGLIGAGNVAFNYETVLDYSSYGYLDIQGIVRYLKLPVA
jgi:TRAP-type uncharacterized transport system fused permease subunit